jgi:hypothetical protein
MASTSNFSGQFSPDTWQDALRLIAGFSLFWALAAGLLFIAAPGLETFGRLLVFHECGGTVIIVCALLIRRSRWFPKASPMVRWLLTGLIAIPTGYVVGHVLTFLILGEPIRFVSQGQDRMIPIVFTLLVAGFGLYFFTTREQLAIEAAVRLEAQRLAAESQLRMLRAQLEPHMLFNTLANLRSLLSEDPKQAEVMIDRLIIYLRSALDASRTESTTLSREFSQLRAYLGIMAIRMGSRLSYSLTLPAEMEKIAIPPMLLQPLVENAIKHGLEPKVGAGKIEVIAQAHVSTIEIAVIDSGLGLLPHGLSAEPSDAASNGFGLQHVRQSLQSAFGARASLVLRPAHPGGVCAVITIPM